MDAILSAAYISIELLVLFVPPLFVIAGVISGVVCVAKNESRHLGWVLLGGNAVLGLAWALLFAPSFVPVEPIVRLDGGLASNAMMFGLVGAIYAVNVGVWLMLWRRTHPPRARQPIGEW